MMDQAEIIRILTAEYPPQIYYVPSLVLLVLAFVSLVDARTGRVPDVPVVAALLGALGSLAWYAGWPVAGERTLYVIAAILILRAGNMLYARLFGHDAIGFGDAKWTGLAVAAFDYEPVFWGWIIAAWLGLIWMGGRWLWYKVSNAYNPQAYVHFAPFLFIGLIASLFRKAILSF